MKNVTENIALEKTQELNEAYMVLKDINIKNRYDEQLKTLFLNSQVSINEKAQEVYKYYKDLDISLHYRAPGYQQANSQDFNFTQSKNQNQKLSSETKAGLKFGVICLIVLIICFAPMIKKSKTRQANDNADATFTEVIISNGQTIKKPTGECLGKIVVETKVGQNYSFHNEKTR